jgi:phosphoglycolate phosphatase-like HAD superfamily hydrolase
MDDGHSIKTILFDMDGVLTSEKAYWQSSALAIFEYFNDDYELNTDFCYENVDTIMDTVFSANKTIDTAKNLGVNSNWDLTYITILSAEILKTKGISIEKVFDEIPEFLISINTIAPILFDELASLYSEIFNFDIDACKKEGQLYLKIQKLFQEWYLGDDLFFKYYSEKPKNSKGKNNLISKEEPLLGIEKTKDILSYLYNKGYTLGIGTGRPQDELYTPLRNWDILKYFDEKRIVTYTDVINYQRIYNNNKTDYVSFAKPHPFSFIKASKGEEFNFLDIEKNTTDSSVLVVGDALCDILAAKNAGFKFCAVLTGIDGKDSEIYFQNEGADYIIDDATHLKKLV